MLHTMVRERHGSDVRQAALLRYDKLIDEGASISRAQVEIAHGLDVSVATVQRWIRDRRSQQERESLLADTISGDGLSVGDCTSYGDVADHLARFYASAARKQDEFDERLTGDPERHLAATLQLAANVRQAVEDGVKCLVALAMSENVPANRVAMWSNVAPATLRLWEREEQAKGRV